MVSISPILARFSKPTKPKITSSNNFGGFSSKQSQQSALEKAINESRKNNPNWFASTPKVNQTKTVQQTTVTPTETRTSTKTLYQKQLEKNQRAQHAKEISQGKHIVEQYDIHTKKLAGIKNHGGNTDNLFYKSGKQVSAESASNLPEYLNETYGVSVTENFSYGNVDNIKQVLKPVKYTQKRKEMAQRELDLAEQNKRISEINTGNDKIVTEHHEDTSVNYTTAGGSSPVEQDPYSVGNSQVFTSGSEDTTNLSLGNNPDNTKGKVQTSNEKVSQEDKSFIEKSGGMLAIAGIGLLGLFLLTRRK